MMIHNASPMHALEINKSIKRLDKIATWFMKKRLFTLEDITQKLIDWYIDHNYAKYCVKCKTKTDWWHMKPSGECRWCWMDRMIIEYHDMQDAEYYKHQKMLLEVLGWHP